MKKIYVGNLPYQATSQDIEDAFSAFGSVTSVNIIEDRETGRSKGFAFVEMDNDEEAQAAVEGMNGKEIAGRVVTVDLARPRENRGGGGGGRGGRGGRPGGGGGGYGGGGGGRSGGGGGGGGRRW